MANEVSGGVEYYVDVDTSKAIASTKSIDTQTKKIEKSFKGVDTQVKKSSKAVNNAMSGMGRSAGQAGIQVQQLVGQIQGGQNVMQAFAAQSADLGIVLGAPLVGVIASLSFALGGALAPALFNATSNLEKFETAVEQVKATLTLSAEGVASYSEQMKKLSLISKELAATQLKVTIAQQQQAFKLGSKALREYTADVTSFTRGFSSFSDRVEDLTGQKLGADGFNEARAALIAFKTEATAFSLKPNADSVYELEQSLIRLEEAGGSTTQKGRELIDMALKQIQAFREGEITIQELNKALKDNKEITVSSTQAKIDNSNAVEELVKAVELEAQVYGVTDRALALHTAYVKGAIKADYDAINAAYDKIEALKAESDAEKLAAAEKKKAESEQRAKEGKAVGFAEGIIGRGLSPAEKLEIQEQELESIRAQGLINLELYEQAKTSIVEQQEKLRQQASIASQNLILMSASSFFGETAELVKNSAGEQSSAYKTLFAISKGFAIANAALNLGTALSNASALPYPVNIPAFIQAGVQGAQLASQIASVSYGGGRENGGPVSGNKLYEVGEKNKPELFQSGGKQYMIPGNNGNVTSNADMQGGGGNLNVKVVNLPGQTAQVSQSGEGVSRETVIQIIGQQSGSVGSEMNRNINKNHNVTNRLASNRRN